MKQFTVPSGLISHKHLLHRNINNFYPTFSINVVFKAALCTSETKFFLKLGKLVYVSTILPKEI